MVKWNTKDKEKESKEVEEVKEAEVVSQVDEEQPKQEEETEQVEEPVQEQMGYDDAIKIVSRDLVKAGTDLAVGYDKKLSEVLQSVADKVTEITG